MIPPRLVIFDCDGVLVDSERITLAILAANLARHGLRVTEADCLSLFLGATMAGVGDKARGLGADLPESWVADIYAEMYARLREGVDPIPGIPELLDRLDAASIRYCVASNGQEEKMDITLTATSLAARFGPRRFSAYTVGSAKPDPGLFLHAAATFGVSPENAVVIEDSANGARAARAAGMRCLGYTAHTPAQSLSDEGAEVFADMAMVPGLIGLR